MQPKNNADQPAEDLVLEVLPNGEHGWLRPEHHTPRVGGDLGSAHWPPEIRVDITNCGRDYLAL